MVSPSFTLPKSQANTPSVRKTWYLLAPATAPQERPTELLPAVAVTFGAVVGMPAQPESCTTGV